MILLRKILILTIIISVFIFLQNAFGLICVNTTANYKMFGSIFKADVLKNPFIMAFQNEDFKNYKIYYANYNTRFTDQIQNMIKDKCSVILGLFTSQDCLISGPILKKNKVIGLSSSCSEDHITNFSPYIYTLSPKLSDFSRKIASYLNKIKQTKKIYVFYQPSDVYSTTSFEFFRKYINKPLVSIPVDSEGNFNSDVLDKDKENTITIIFFTYPLPSAQILVTLDTNHLITDKITIIGASSWIFDVSVFRSIKSIFDKAKAVFAPSLADQKRIDLSDFSYKH